MGTTSETWIYDRTLRRDKEGTRWHFVSHFIHDPDVPYEERPFQLFFRNDDRTEFGVLRFERQKDNPYRNYEATVLKIINKRDFRRSLIDLSTRSIWKKSWK